MRPCLAYPACVVVSVLIVMPNAATKLRAWSTCFSLGQYLVLVQPCCTATQSMRPIARALRVFAHAENLPIIIHCIHGKDRTGLIIALLLLLLGVDEPTVVLDYAKSELELKVDLRTLPHLLYLLISISHVIDSSKTRVLCAVAAAVAVRAES